MTNKESVAIAFENLKAKHEEMSRIRFEKCEELKKTDKKYAEICSAVSDLGSEYAIASLKGDKEKCKKLSAEIETLENEKTQILKNNNILGEDYICPLCNDTGETENGICSCVLEMAKKIYSENMAKEIPLNECCFNNFDLSFYTEQEAKSRMTSIFALCKEYAQNFNPSSSQNLLFMGRPGLGKTHLSLSIVNEVIKKGYSVMYGPAYNIFAKMENDRFDTHTSENFDTAIGVDLLVIDDLGGEFMTAFVQSTVYNIINTRILLGKPTIISTNLAIDEIQKRYTPRVASRIIGDYKPKIFLGTDVRQAKMLRNE